MDCRNYEYCTACDSSVCYIMDLAMYSNVYKNCIINPGRDKCKSVNYIGLGGLRAQATDQHKEETPL